MRKVSLYFKSVILSVVALTGLQQVQAQDLTDNMIKTNVSHISEPLKVITSLQPMTFEYNTRQYSHLKLPSGRQYGFMAEDFQQVLPGLVHKKPYSFMSGKNSYRNATVKTIDMESLVPVLIASIKEQQTQIDQLRAELEALKRR